MAGESELLRDKRWHAPRRALALRNGCTDQRIGVYSIAGAPGKYGFLIEAFAERKTVRMRFGTSMYDVAINGMHRGHYDTEFAFTGFATRVGDGVGPEWGEIEGAHDGTMPGGFVHFISGPGSELGWMEKELQRVNNAIRNRGGDAEDGEVEAINDLERSIAAKKKELGLS